jgi:hypothetical protein
MALDLSRVRVALLDNAGRWARPVTAEPVASRLFPSSALQLCCSDLSLWCCLQVLSVTQHACQRSLPAVWGFWWGPENFSVFAMAGEMSGA